MALAGKGRHIDAVFSYLTGNRISEACRLAQKEGENRKQQSVHAKARSLSFLFTGFKEGKTLLRTSLMISKRTARCVSGSSSNRRNRQHVTFETKIELQQDHDEVLPSALFLLLCSF